MATSCWRSTFRATPPSSTQDTGDCLYVVGELTDLAQTAERQLGIQTYLPPIIAGSGQGATFAYAALADAPANTLGGAVGLGFANKLSLKEAFCPGAASTKAADGAFSYGFDVALPEAAYLLVDPADVDDVTDKASAQDNITVDTVDPDNGPAQVTQAVSDLAETDQPFGDLPAVDLPSSDNKPAALAILVSGDGGWRDLDKTIGEWLSARGVHVVGLDSLHYFWSKRTPKELATDIASIVERADPDKKLPVMLIGYSFGADTIPFAFPLLPQDLQQRTKLLALMAPGLTTSFQVTIEGWLDIDDSGYEIVPAIAALPADRVVCVYGEDEGRQRLPRSVAEGGDAGQDVRRPPFRRRLRGAGPAVPGSPEGEVEIAMLKTDLSDIYRGYIACLNKQDWAKLEKFVDDDACHNGRQIGISGYREMLERDFHEIPDLYFDVQLLISDPPYIAARLGFDCTPKGKFLGLNVNGKRVLLCRKCLLQISRRKNRAGMVAHRQGGHRSPALVQTIIAPDRPSSRRPP